MILYSYKFLLFFLAVVGIYYAIPHRYRWFLLLVASYGFYMCWRIEYAIILVIATFWDYWIARLMNQSSNPLVRKRYLILSLFLNLVTLFTFKYLIFFSDAFHSILSLLNLEIGKLSFKLLLPVGISYYMFKKISYIVDIYREQQTPEMHWGKFALYISFFPEIVSGPIDRAKDLLPQFHQNHLMDFQRIIDGLKLFAWGMLKKVVIADRLAIFVNEVFNQPENFQGISMVIAGLFFSVQIYADFSGYTDMAIGIGQVLGFQLADNFNRPYMAKTISEFWKRWHISLTSWLKDYLFLPCAFAVSRRIKIASKFLVKAESWAYIVATMVTMLLCGLWHGAGWTFVLWGALHGGYLVISHLTRKPRKNFRKKMIPKFLKTPYQYLRIFFTFLMVTLLWVFFRANSVGDAFYIIGRIFNPNDWTAFTMKKEWIKKVILLGQSSQEFLIAVLSIGFMIFIHWVQSHEGIRSMFCKKSIIFRWVMYILIVLLIMNLGIIEEIPFIYSEF